jgi:hypothetical protein
MHLLKFSILFRIDNMQGNRNKALYILFLETLYLSVSDYRKGTLDPRLGALRCWGSPTSIIYKLN